MTHFITTVDSNKTFGSNDDGILQYVVSVINLTIPNDNTYSFREFDTLEIFNSSAGQITFNVESGITLHAKGSNIILQNGYVIFRKIGDNEWIAWGDLV